MKQATQVRLAPRLRMFGALFTLFKIRHSMMYTSRDKIAFPVYPRINRIKILSFKLFAPRTDTWQVQGDVILCLFMIYTHTTFHHVTHHLCTVTV